MEKTTAQKIAAQKLALEAFKAKGGVHPVLAARRAKESK